MKIAYVKREAARTHPHLIKIDGSWKELRQCDRWVRNNLKLEARWIKYIDVDDDEDPLPVWKTCSIHKELWIRINNDEDAMAFKLAFE